jgi:hypothetical protein
MATDVGDEGIFRTVTALSRGLELDDAQAVAGPFTWREAHAFSLFARGQVSMCQAVRFLAPYSGREPMIELVSRPDHAIDMVWDQSCVCAACWR